MVNTKNINGYWKIPDNLDTESFDFNWRPDWRDPPYIHQFGTQWQKTGGPQWVVEGAFGVKYQSGQIARALPCKDNYKVCTDEEVIFDWSWHPDNTEPPYIYTWGNQSVPGEVAPTLEYHAPGATVRKYMPDPVTIIHKPTNILFIKHSSGNILTTRLPENIKVFEVEYRSSYVQTILNWLRNNPLNEKFLWVISNVCDYANFDFTWKSTPFNHDQLHVFASSIDNIKQQFGDTFYINVQKFIDGTTNLENLENYPYGVNYISGISVPRLPHPVIEYRDDTCLTSLSNVSDNFPYTELVDIENLQEAGLIEPPKLWNDKVEIIIGSSGGTQLFIPYNAVNVVKNEIYDYPYIITAKKMGKNKPLDVIFLSNDEPIAEYNFEWLYKIIKENGAGNRIVRVKNVQGRVASQHTAAKISNTNWYFLINGKLRVDENFDWSWQPDRLQVPKHYIFIAENPVNGLRYGHQAIVANNKKLTLQTDKNGLDFTLDSPHCVTDIYCGVACYNTDPWTTWRTAFREAIKLKCNTDQESMQRLNCWLTVANGNNAEWSKRGALDGVEYWSSVNGNHEKLIYSYEWKWLNDFWSTKYGE